MPLPRSSTLARVGTAAAALTLTAGVVVAAQAGAGHAAVTTGRLTHAGPAVPSRPAAGAAARARPMATSRRAIDGALQAKVADRMARSTAGSYGVVAQIAGVGRVVSIEPSLALRPASTQKLFTTLPLLLDAPARRLVTTVTVTAAPVQGVVHGDLVVHATGDPSMLKRDFTSLAEQVAAAGVTRVTGHLTLDIGSLPTHTRRPGWKHDFVPDDVGPLSPFPVYEDVWRHDASYLAHPTAANLLLLRRHLHSAGVRIAGADATARTAPAGRTVARHRSAPMRTLVKHTLRISDNFYAEQLLVVAGGKPRVQSLETSAGVTGESSATDGSGLSYADRETTGGEVALLAYARGSHAYGDLVGALPVACKYGTLKHRFCHTGAALRVFAKTGTLNHTTALSGYTVDGRGRQVTFSIITSGVHSVTAAMRATDKAVLVLHRYTG